MSRINLVDWFLSGVLPTLLLILFYFVPVAAQSQPAKEVALTEANILKLENAALRAENIIQQLVTLQAKLNEIQATAIILQGQRTAAEKTSTELFEAVCKELNVDPKKYKLDDTGKKLVLR